MALIVTVVGGLESEARACLLNSQCSGTAPICGVPALACRACASDLECGAPLSGRTCATTGAQAGACVVPASVDAGADSGVIACTLDSQCGVGEVCDSTSGPPHCVAGCHVLLGADSCGVSLSCSILDGHVGACVLPAGADGGVTGVLDGSLDLPGTCSEDTDCTVGTVCDETMGGALGCVAGCHDLSVGGDTCLAGTHCSIVSIGVSLGVCVGDGAVVDASASVDATTGDAAVFQCSMDMQCAGGEVCTQLVGGDTECVAGCHLLVGGGSTCGLGTTCDILGPGLSVGSCEPSNGGTDGGPGAVDSGPAGGLDASAPGTDASADSGGGPGGGSDGGPGQDAATTDSGARSQDAAASDGAAAADGGGPGQEVDSGSELADGEAADTDGGPGTSPDGGPVSTSDGGPVATADGGPSADGGFGKDGAPGDGAAGDGASRDGSDSADGGPWSVQGDGCSCRAAGSDGSGAGILAFLGLFFVAARRRRARGR